MHEPLEPAKQARSRQTQERILEATKRLLREDSFDSISIRKIIDEAKTTTGSFYARFRDKNALLPVLYQEYENRLITRLDQLRDSLERADSLNQVAGLIVAHFIETFGESPNLSRALYEFVTRSPKTLDSKRLAKRRRREHAFLLDALLRFSDEFHHPNPDRAVEMGLYIVSVVCRNRLHYPDAPQTRSVQLSKKELRVELTRMMIGYLRDGQSHETE